MNRSETLPRASLIRIPQQQRAVDTVFRIIDTTWQMLGESGIDALNTNDIAKRADVNISAIYQYFANKEMIIAGILESFFIQFERAIRDLIKVGDEQRPEDTIGNMINFGIESLQPIAPELRVLFQAVPVISNESVAGQVERLIMDIGRDFLIRNGDRYVMQGGVASLYVLANTASLVTIRWLSEQPGYFTTEEFKQSLLLFLTAPFRENISDRKPG